MSFTMPASHKDWQASLSFVFLAARPVRWQQDALHAARPSGWQQETHTHPTAPGFFLFANHCVSGGHLLSGKRLEISMPTKQILHICLVQRPCSNISVYFPLRLLRVDENIFYTIQMYTKICVYIYICIYIYI